MNQNEEITKAQNSIKRVLETNDQFLVNARNNVSQDLQTKLEFECNNIVVNIFGYKVCSEPRVVQFKNNFYMEYLFLVRFEGEDHEVTRFYLKSDGTIYKCLDPESKMCDYDSEKISHKIFSQVAIGLLESPVFSVAKRPTDKGDVSLLST